MEHQRFISPGSTGALLSQTRGFAMFSAVEENLGGVFGDWAILYIPCGFSSVSDD
jgi:hypothetical protein